MAASMTTFPADDDQIPIVGRAFALDRGESRRSPPSKRSLENSRKMVFALAAVSALLVIPVAALSFLSQRQDNKPVVELSFQRMGKTVDTWLGEVEHETDVGNILNGRTHVERDIQSLIHGKSGTMTMSRKALVSSSSGKGNMPDKPIEGALKAHAAPASKPQPHASAKTIGDSRTVRETPLASHWVVAPVKKRAPVKSSQEQLRALGGPEIVYEASKELKKRNNRPRRASPAFLRARRLADMKTDEGASRQLARYFAGAHSAVSVHPPGAPFAQARLWTLGTEKADMNHYFDKLAKQTESHVREIRNLHRAVEPSTKWQDGLERARDDKELTRLAGDESGDESGSVMRKAASVLSLARSDLRNWKHAHPEVKHVH